MNRSIQLWGLYVLTFFFELIPGLVRWLLVTFLFFLIHWAIYYGALIVSGIHNFAPQAFDVLRAPGLLRTIYFVDVIGQVLAAFFAGTPLVLSILALILPSSGYLATRWSLGAREPSARELQRVKECFDELTAAAPRLFHTHPKFFVVDALQPIAFSMGTTLYISNELIKSPFFTPVVAHELGHITSSDAQIQLALKSFRVRIPELFAKNIGTGAANSLANSIARGNVSGTLLFGGTATTALMTLLSRGGFGQDLLKIPWANYWQGRVVAADQFAADCGQVAGLIEYLEKYEAFGVSVAYFATDKPPTELRIARLKARIDDDAAVVPSTVPSTRAAERIAAPPLAPNVSVPTHEGGGIGTLTPPPGQIIHTHLVCPTRYIYHTCCTCCIR